MTITTKPMICHGRIRRTTSETGTVRNVNPVSRRSSTIVRPTKRHSAQTWTDSTQPTHPPPPDPTPAYAVATPPMISVELIEIAVIPGSHPYHVVPVETSPPIQLRT